MNGTSRVNREVYARFCESRRVRFPPATHPLAESVNALYKKEVIGQADSWNDVAEVMMATAEWVSWYNNDRLHSWCGHRPPLEFEQDYWRDAPEQPQAA